MTAQYQITEEAEYDLRDIAGYIALDSFNAAERFFDNIEESFDLIVSMPEIGMIYPLENPKLKHLRRWPVKHFENYLIFYIIIEDEVPVKIIRIIHGARDIPTLFNDEKYCFQ